MRTRKKPLNALKQPADPRPSVKFTQILSLFFLFI